MNEDRVEIVLVEDNPNDLELALYAFHKCQLAHKIHVARDGNEAINFFFDQTNGDFIARKVAPKLVFLDLKLPKVNGLEVLRLIKSHPSTKNIPVVVLTSSQQDRDMARAYSFGANGYMIKPVNFPEFVEDIRVVLLYWLSINQLPGLEQPPQTDGQSN